MTIDVGDLTNFPPMVLFFWGVWRVLFTLSIDYPTGTGQVSYA